MPEVRVCIALHFTFDPAKGLPKLPDEITKTISVGEAIIPEKIPSSAIGGKTKELILKEMDKLVFAAQKKAKPAPKAPPVAKAGEKAGEQGSLL